MQGGDHARLPGGLGRDVLGIAANIFQGLASVQAVTAEDSNRVESMRS